MKSKEIFKNSGGLWESQPLKILVLQLQLLDGQIQRNSGDNNLCPLT